MVSSELLIVDLTLQSPVTAWQKRYTLQSLVVLSINNRLAILGNQFKLEKEPDQLLANRKFSCKFTQSKKQNVGRNWFFSGSNWFSFAMCCSRGNAGCWLCFANGSQPSKLTYSLQQIVYKERITGTGRLKELVLLSCGILQRCDHKLFTMEVTSLPQPTSEALTRECLRSGSRGRPFFPDQVEF